MTKSNKILLNSLLNLEFELGKFQRDFHNSQQFINIQLNFNYFYDLFNVIILAFNIPKTNYDQLYDILNNLYLNQISPQKALDSIEFLIK